MNFNASKIAILFTAAFMLSLFTIRHIEEQGTTTAIDITGLSFTPSTIDVTNSFQTITLTIRVTDTERDIVAMSLVFRSPLTDYHDYFAPGDRISGNARDGIYRKTFTFSRYAKAGIWYISGVSISDGVLDNNGGSVIYQRRDFSTADLVARGFPTQIQVINNNETVPPEISDFSFTPSAINVANGSRNVSITLRAKDETSGVGYIYVSFTNPPGCYYYDDDCATLFSISISGADRISGNDKDGVYRVVVTVPQQYPLGIYSASVTAGDAVQNYKFLNSAELAALGFPSQLQVSAAPFASISGRVLTPDGLGLRNAVVSLTDSLGVRRNATTTSFGNFTFYDIRTGETYTVTVNSKRYRFTTRTLQVESDLTNLDFVGLE